MEHDLRAADVGLDCVDGLLHDEPDANGRGEMEHAVGAIHQLGHQRLVHDGVDAIVEPLVRAAAVEVLDGAGRQVVDHRHRIARGE